MKLAKVLALSAMLMPIPAIAQNASVDRVGPVVSAIPPVPVIGQATADATAVDPARLAAAHKLIDQIVPPAKRDSMIEQIVRPMIANMRQSFEQSPEFAKTFAEQPEAKKQMFDFMAGETERSLRLTRESLPTLFDAMAVAYARRFTLVQLADIGRFFDTPTGRYYAEQAPTIMADPAVQAAQRAMVAKSLEGLQDRVKAMADKIQASAKKDSAS